MCTCATNTHEYDLNDFIEDLHIPKLTDEQRYRIEGPITLQDCKLALDTFQANKTPGEDGFTVEFNKYFVGLLGKDLVASFNIMLHMMQMNSPFPNVEESFP